MPDFLRTAHGAGADALLRAETPPLDEIPAPNAAHTEQGLALAAARGRPFQPGNAAASNRKPAMARAGLEVPGADPRWQSFERQGRRWAQRRCREMAVAHGGYLGCGPSSMIASAGLALASSRFAYAVGAASGDIATLKQAAQLADSARQQELTAVALAERECATRKANAPYEDDMIRISRMAGGDAADE